MGALAFVRAYENALIAGDYARAWSMLGPESQATWGTLSAFASERGAFIHTACCKYTAIANPPGVMSMAEWLSAFSWPGKPPVIDTANAVLVEVDWLAPSLGNAGWEIWVVNPVPGAWQLFKVR